MLKKMKIFNVVFGLAICVLPGALHADDLSACDGYEYFSPAFAMCSVHAYNIGDQTNPTSATRTAEMNDVIALKSTVIAQQLKQQYDALNAMIKRFKTQLEKAVLTSKIEVITGNNSSSTSSSGSYVSTVGGVIVAGASDCMTYSGSSNIGSCLMTNSAIITNVANSDTSAAKKQLANDLYVAHMYSLCSLEKSDTNDKENNKTSLDLCCNQVQLASKQISPQNISNKVNGLDKNGVIQCAQMMKARISTGLEDKQNRNRNNYNWGNNYPGDL